MKPLIPLALGLAFLVSASLSDALYGQTFTKITEGEIVTQRTVSAGASWGDYDNDGYLDLYVTNRIQALDELDDRRNELYHNNGDGTFTRILEGAVVEDQSISPSSVWVDADNDGFLDLYVSNSFLIATPTLPQANAFYHNNGDGTFTRLTGGPAEDANGTISSGWGDYDHDGDLDVFAGDNIGVQNLFYRNDGNGAFSLDETPPFVETGLFNRSGTWVDYDDDGDDDLFVVNFSFFANTNELYRNRLVETGLPTFEAVDDVALVTSVEVNNVMGVSWIDYDNNGDLDAFMTTLGVAAKDHLFRNEGGGVFTRIAQGDLLVTGTRSSRGSCWGDYDNDGDLDVFITTGNQSSNTKLENEYYVNDGAGGFTQVTDGVFVTEGTHSVGCAAGDYDNDGDLDLFVANGNNPTSNSDLQLEPNFLFRNDDGNQNNWIIVTLRGTTSNRFGVGAKVFATASIGGVARTQMRWVSGSPTGNQSQNSQRVHVGLGDAAALDELIVQWPSGQVDTLVNVATNQFLTITETGLPTATEDEPALPRWLALHEAYPNPVHATATIRYVLPRAAFVTLKMYDLLGRQVAALVHGDQPAGLHEAIFEARRLGLPSGVYVYRLQAGAAAQTRTLVVRR